MANSADERSPTHYTSEDARRFTTVLAHRLGLTERFIQPGYEDVYYYLWRERRLPVNVDPFDSKLDDEMEPVKHFLKTRIGIPALSEFHSDPGEAEIPDPRTDGGVNVETQPRHPGARSPRAG